jgi:hypothetical protein
MSAAVALACVVHAGPASASCGSAFCMVNTSWDVQGVAAEPGLRLDLRFEYIKQDQPRTGTRDLRVGEIPQHHDEVQTYNRNYVGTIDYTFNERWGVTASVPFTDRWHYHIHNHRGAQLAETWDYARLGDVRVIGRYQMRSEKVEAQRLDFYGINFGLKLPTGSRRIVNENGERAERTLQPGTGTTDAIIGGYYNVVFGDSAWFAQTLFQWPVDSVEEYRPGKRLTLDVGYRYAVTDKLGLLVQVNYLHRRRDQGAQAEPNDSGGNFVYVSPGVSYAFSKSFQFYAFVQKPVYQHVNGVQLVADWTALAGITGRF